jgi:hypothetical protein
MNGEGLTMQANVMARAWVIFRQTYRYPAIPFRSIGRKCFAWALRKAWSEAKEAARVATIPAPVKQARAAALTRELDLLPLADDYRFVVARGQEIRSALAELAT